MSVARHLLPSNRTKCKHLSVNLVVKHDLIGEPVERDGQTYMHIRDYKVKFIPQRVLLHFSNLFNGDKRLGDRMNM